MPHHKSAKKRLKTTARDNLRNGAIISNLRKQLKRQRSAEGDAAREALPETYAALDTAVRKGVIHPRRADRLKSRLARSVEKAVSAQ